MAMGLAMGTWVLLLGYCCLAASIAVAGHAGAGNSRVAAGAAAVTYGVPAAAPTSTAAAAATYFSCSSCSL